MTDETEIRPEDVIGEPPPVADPPWIKKPPPEYPGLTSVGLRDPQILAKAQAARKENLAERRRKADRSRADLSVDFLGDVHELWREHGKTILARAAFAHPEKVAKIIADLMPKQMEIKSSAVQDLDDDRLHDLIGAISERLGRGAEAALGAAEGRSPPKIIDATAVELRPIPEAKGVS
jgi:hypothetical protein